MWRPPRRACGTQSVCVHCQSFWLTFLWCVRGPSPLGLWLLGRGFSQWVFLNDFQSAWNQTNAATALDEVLRTSRMTHASRLDGTLTCRWPLQNALELLSNFTASKQCIAMRSNELTDCDEKGGGKSYAPTDICNAQALPTASAVRTLLSRLRNPCRVQDAPAATTRRASG